MVDAQREAYAFAGWFTEPTGGVHITKDMRVRIAGDITLYARWTPIEYTITYDLNNGVIAADNPQKYTIESAEILLADPTKTGYKFLGWYNNATLVEKIEQGSYGDITLKANWEIIVYNCQ